MCRAGSWLVVQPCAANQEPERLALTQLLTLTTTQKIPPQAVPEKVRAGQKLRVLVLRAEEEGVRTARPGQDREELCVGAQDMQRQEKKQLNKDAHCTMYIILY